MPGELVGRRNEQAAVSRFVRACAPAAVLVLRGNPGIGKTELWRFACREAGESGCTVLRATAVASEAGLAYGALADLLARASFDQLEPAQRDALGSVLARGSGRVEPRRVAAAFLALLTASDGTVLVAVDDIQWLDPASATVLGYALRRLEGEPVRAVVSARSGSDLPLELPDGRSEVIDLGPLSLGALHHLLNERLGLSLRRPLVYRVHAVSGGNPLYALELARELARSNNNRKVELELPESLRAVVEARIAELPDNCLAALRVAALAEAPTLSLIDEVTAGGAAALDPAFVDGVVVLDRHRVRFAHPLYAEGVVAATPPSEVRLLHARLAEVVHGGAARARHRARAALGPDEAAAAELEQVAREELERGAAVVAADLAADALSLSEGDPPCGRVFLAARAFLSAGELDRARVLLLERLPTFEPGDERCRAFLLLARSVGTNVEMLEFAASAVDEAQDPVLRAEALLGNATAHALGMLDDLPAQLARVAEAAGLLSATGASVERATAISTWVAALAGRPAPALGGARDAGGTFYDSQERARGLVLLWRGELDAARPVFERGLERARELGEDESITSALLQLAELEARAGRVSEASRLADAAALGAGDADGRAMAPRIRAAAGLPAAPLELTAALAAEAVELARRGQYVWQELEARRVAGAAALLAGDIPSAIEKLGAVHRHLIENGIANPGAFPVAADLAEAHLLAGEAVAAEALCAELEAAGREQDHPWAASAGARVRGLLADAAGDTAAAERALTYAVGRAAEVGLELDAARALLALGVACRHAKRRGEARDTLAEAVAAFERLGATLYADRVHGEAARVAGRRRASDELTETEAQVAALVAAGKTNREVAAVLSLSVRGVESNLSRIYGKLGVRSRTELAARASRAPNSVGSHISREERLP